MKLLSEAIENAVLEYQSDIEWNYRFSNKKVSVDFYKDGNGKNHVEEFVYFHNGIWVSIKPTDEQSKRMWTILNETPYREVETFSETISDLYDYNGVKRSDFY